VCQSQHALGWLYPHGCLGDHRTAGFVAARGAAAHAERLVPLHGEEVGLRFDEDMPAIDTAALRAALLTPRVEAWLGVLFGAMEPFDGLALWLATVLDECSMLSRARSERARELADPASPIATPTALATDSFAYLTFPEVDPGSDRHEFGAYAHGRDAARLADVLVEQVRAWDRDHHHGSPTTITIHPASTPHAALPHSRVIAKRHCAVVVAWR
jgi:protein-L-isoaspartate(D-aspartate) O-methyltransferase